MSDKSSSKRHCMIVYAPYPLGETRVQREAEILLKHGYEVDVISLRLPDDLPVDIYKGVRIYREKYRFPVLGARRTGLRVRLFNYLLFFFTSAWRVTQLHLSKPYDTIQVHNLPDFLVFCSLVPKLLGVPIILDLHDLMPEFFAGRFQVQKSLALRLIEMQEQLSCRFATHVITVSDHWRETLIRRGVPAPKCSVIMNVADDMIFRPCQAEEIQLRHENQFRLVYHGSIHERYGLDLAVEAVDQLRKDIPNIHLTLLGRGDFLSEIEKMVVERDLCQHVSIEDLHLVEELPGILSACDLGIVPYKDDIFTDGLLPTKLMEYAALGLPAVASRTTAIQAYFGDANTVFFEPGNADDLAQQIRFLYNHPETRAELARGSQKFNQRYNWGRVGAEYVALVESLRLRKISTGKSLQQQNLGSRTAK